MAAPAGPTYGSVSSAMGHPAVPVNVPMNVPVNVNDGLGVASRTPRSVVAGSFTFTFTGAFTGQRPNG